MSKVKIKVERFKNGYFQVSVDGKIVGKQEDVDNTLNFLIIRLLDALDVENIVVVEKDE